MSATVQVFEADSYHRNDHSGYGTVFLPCAPGFHRLEIVVFRPEGSFVEELTSKFLGGHLRYLKPKVVRSGDR